MNWNTFWTAAFCIAAIAFCAGIYREMVEVQERRKLEKLRQEVAPWRDAGQKALDGIKFHVVREADRDKL